MGLLVQKSACLLALLIGLAPAAFGDPAIPRELGAELAAVDRLLAGGQGEAALAEIERLAGQWGDDPLYGWQIADRRGLALLLAGQPEAALPLLEATVRRDPLSAGPHRNLGLALRRLGRRGRALAEYAQAVELDPGNPAHRVEHGQALAEFGQWDRAAVEFQAAARLCGGCPEAELAWGDALLRAGRPADAVGPLERAHAAQPDPGTRQRLVMALQQAGRDSALLVLLDRTDPRDAAAYDHRARVEAEGRLGGAAPRSLAYAEALGGGTVPASVAADAAFWARVALNLLAAGDNEQGLAAATRAVELAPDNAVYRNNRVVLLLRLGRDDEAEREWEQARRLDPSLEETRRP